MFWICAIPPSAVCSIEMPSLALRVAWFRLATWADIRWDTARPAASSLAELMRRPEDSEAIALVCAPWDFVRLNCAISEFMLVLIDIVILKSPEALVG